MFPISTQHYDDPAEETVAFDPSNELIPHVCLELCLLLYGLLDSILLFNERQTFKVRIELRDEEHTYSAFEWHEDAVTLLMVRRDVEYCLDFYLRCYRDGKGMVDHIDIQLYGDDSNVSYNVFLTFTVPEAYPITGTEEDARKALGLPTRRRKKKQ